MNRNKNRRRKIKEAVQTINSSNYTPTAKMTVNQFEKNLPTVEKLARKGIDVKLSDLKEDEYDSEEVYDEKPFPTAEQARNLLKKMASNETDKKEVLLDAEDEESKQSEYNRLVKELKFLSKDDDRYWEILNDLDYLGTFMELDGLNESKQRKRRVRKESKDLKFNASNKAVYNLIKKMGYDNADDWKKVKAQIEGAWQQLRKEKVIKKKA